MTDAADVLTAVHRYYRSRYGDRYALVTEVSASMQEIQAEDGRPRWHRDLRRIDALVAAGQTLTAIEIKVSRSDFLRESDEKRAPWRALTHRFMYVAPEGIIRPEEVPKGCGLLVMPPGGSFLLPEVRPRLNRSPEPMPFAVTQRLMYKARGGGLVG